MKNTVLCLAIALAFTGAIATTSARGSAVTAVTTATKTSAYPVPVCDPNSGGCGLDQW
jgi:hypothetical protein